MLDLETLSSENNAAIVTIGAVRFDLISGSVWDTPDGTFYRVIIPKSSQKAGGHIDGNTFVWWLNQEEAARKSLLSEEAVPIEVALKDFSSWLRDIPCQGLWGNGADFDNTILRSSYDRLGWTAPWSHKINRCHRTMRSLAPNIKRPEMGVKHNALDDAIAQAHHLIAIWKSL